MSEQAPKPNDRDTVRARDESKQPAAVCEEQNDDDSQGAADMASPRQVSNADRNSRVASIIPPGTMFAIGRKSEFPGKLRRLLADAEREGNQDLVSWLPNGASFQIHKPKDFATKILTRYFNHGQYRSFTRQLYHYGFGTVDRTVESGVDMGAFSHPKFLRDRPDLDYLIRRKPASKIKGKLPDRQPIEMKPPLGKIEQDDIIIQPPTRAKAPRQEFAASPAPSPEEGFGMLESPFQALGIGRGSPSPKPDFRGIEKGIISGILHNKSRNKSTDRPTKTVIGNVEGTRTGAASQEDKFWNRMLEIDEDERQGRLGTLFGQDDHRRREGEGSSSPQSSMGSIDQLWTLPQEGFFQEGEESRSSTLRLRSNPSPGNEYDPLDDIFGQDLEPRPIEEMILIPVKVSTEFSDHSFQEP